MSESQLVIFYGLSIGAGLALAGLVYVAVEHFRHASRIAVFAWLEPSASDRHRLSIHVDNGSSDRTVIYEAGAILEDGRRILIRPKDEPRINEAPRDLPVTVEAGDRTVVCRFTISRRDAITGFARCYVIRDRKRRVTGPVHGQLEAA
jgi:hypothetical protein